uniref:dCTP deaminase n=1 Tax=Brachybacterium sp. Marseille-Q7125 TaxID=2932815 RepID=UPI001FF49043
PAFEAVEISDLSLNDNPTRAIRTLHRSDPRRPEVLLRRYDTTPLGVIDSLHPPATKELVIPADGLVLQPGQLYIGNTVERIGSSCYVPSLIGRSSLGRLGMYLQLSADMGNLGASHQWTLEITVVQPLRVYPGMVCGQVSFWVPTGEVALYDGLLGTLSAPTVPSAAMMKEVISR